MKRLLALLVISLVFQSVGIWADEGKVLKVLPQFLDRDGKHTIDPSLYERDAYQAWLRKNPSERSTVRFAVHYKYNFNIPAQLKVEIRGGKSHQNTPLVLHADVAPRRWFNRWTYVVIPRADYEKLGDVIAWKVSMVQSNETLSSQQSFLWDAVINQ